MLFDTIKVDGLKKMFINVSSMQEYKASRYIFRYVTLHEKHSM